MQIGFVWFGSLHNQTSSCLLVSVIAPFPPLLPKLVLVHNLVLDLVLVVDRRRIKEVTVLFQFLISSRILLGLVLLTNHRLHLLLLLLLLLVEVAFVIVVEVATVKTVMEVHLLENGIEIEIVVLKTTTLAKVNNKQQLKIL